MTRSPAWARLSGLLSYGTVAAGLQGARFLSVLLAAQMLGPEKFAPWLLLSGLLGYCAFMQLGMSNGLYRELPAALGAGAEEKASSLAATASSFLLNTSIAYALIFLALPFFHRLELSLSTYLLFALLVLVNQFYNLQHVLSHSFFHFRELTVQMGVFGALLLPLTWILTGRFGLPGFIVAQAVLMLFSFRYLHGFTASRLKAPFDRRLLRSMITTGMPISIIGVLFFAFTTLDRWAISHYLGKESLGYYALSVFCVNALSILTKVVSPQFYPRMSYLWGQTGRVDAIRGLVWRQFLANVLLMLSVALLFFLSVEPLVARFMPQYLPGVGAARIIMAGVVFLACVNPFAALMNSTGRHLAYLATQGGAILISVIGIFYAVSVHRSIEAVAVATTAGYFLYMASMVAVGCRILYPKRETGREGA